MIRTARSLFLLTGLVFALPCWADLIPPGVDELQQRASKQPNAIDRSDDYCKDKAINDACHIPGTPFDGGGAGLCRRYQNSQNLSLDLVCQVQEPLEIPRLIPNTPYMTNPHLCAMEERIRAILHNENISCQPVAPVSDQYCQNKAEGAPCTVPIKYPSHSVTHIGVCKQITLGSSFYLYGRQGKYRYVTQCVSSNPVPAINERPMKPATIKAAIKQLLE